MTHTLRGAVALVTGGAGLIGSHIVDQLAAAGVREVRVLDNLLRGTLDNLAEARSAGCLKFIQGDIRDPEVVRDAVAGCDFVFHQAAIRITLCASQPRDCMEVLVHGAFNVFEAAARAGVKKLVYASSASVYGGSEAFPTTESHHPYNNRTLYGSAKLLNEGMAKHFHDLDGLPSVGLRYFNVYGPRMDVTGAYTEVFGRWLTCIDEGRAPAIDGDGSTSMDLVYVEDIARANLLASQSDRACDVYNVASGTETSLLDLWAAMQEMTGAHHLAPVHNPPRKVNAVPRRLADTRKAREELGFVAGVSLQEGLRRLVAWRAEALAGQEVAA